MGKKDDLKDLIPEIESEEVTEEIIKETEKSEQELLQEKFDDLNDRYLRLMAEYDNFRKRSLKEKDDIYPNAVSSTIQKILPVLDSFERASQFAYNTEDFAKGFDMILSNFKDIMDSLGVIELGKVGEPFDPAYHNAAMHIEDEELGENVISQVFQKGYRIGDRIIRFAMVQTAN